ncbi:MAG: NADH-quinone oxidoreductase subunit L, partial [Polyangiaceae bacterium]|nr:NADH-quinone oxidoreductase subunit L [Polyangiaceae bacterium]
MDSLSFRFDEALLFIILAPLLGSIVIGLFGRTIDKWLVNTIAVGSVAISFVLSIVAFTKLLSAGPEGSIVFHFYEWFSISHSAFGRVPVNFRLAMDSLSGIMSLMVSGIAMLIHIYSIGYMSEEKSYSRFFAYLNLFTASMLVLVLASNLPLMFVGWEGVGLCSYLLIGFWWENPSYAAAGKKAFIANRVGDFGVLIGMFILVATLGSFEFSEINDHSRRLVAPAFEGVEI